MPVPGIILTVGSAVAEREYGYGRPTVLGVSVVVRGGRNRLIRVIVRQVRVAGSDVSMATPTVVLTFGKRSDMVEVVRTALVIADGRRSRMRLEEVSRHGETNWSERECRSKIFCP
jgi:hypothetical protein